MKTVTLWLAVLVAGIMGIQTRDLGAESQIPVAAPINTELAGSTANVALPSVYRILCPKSNTGGTGFAHKSGVIITARHVIGETTASEIVILSALGRRITVTNVLSDADLDLALLIPKEKLSGPFLQISSNNEIAIGRQVSTWGFPEGYDGLLPLLTTGYISGIVEISLKKGVRVQNLVVNAAFNRGNSGGPLVEITSGTVVGVVCSKLAPMPPDIKQYLDALRTNKWGIAYTKKNPDGSTQKMSEAQVLEEILQYLRSQTQLVIGYACPSAHLRTFLKMHGKDP